MAARLIGPGCVWLVLALLAVGCAASANAQPLIPRSELPGRERERFFDRFPPPESLPNNPRLRFEDKRHNRKTPPAPGKRKDERSDERRR